MQFLTRRPGTAYLDNWLWLPKSYFSVSHIAATLTYESHRGDAIEAWEETPHHFKVPRNFLEPGALAGLPFPVVDARFTDFPSVDLHSRVTLDSQDPTKSFQRDGSAALLAAHDGILSLRCGAGKTVVALHTAAQLRVPILVVVGDKGLARQWMDEITEFLGVPANEIGRIGGDGSPFDWKHDITVALVQTLAKRAIAGTLPAELTQHFGVILLDEAHIMGAPYFNTAIPPFHGRRWGLSATPTRDDGFDSLLQRTVGHVVYSYLVPDMMPMVYFRRLPTKVPPESTKFTRDKRGEFHFGKTYGWLAREVPERTALIAAEIRLSIAAGRSVLVLTHSRDMCLALEAQFPEAGVCHGDVGEAERLRRIRQCNPVIAIMQLGKQALNKPNLDTLFVCDPFTKSGVLQQTFGRILRIFSGKKAPAVIFFEDVHIQPMTKSCDSIRKQLARWPTSKGGRIPFKRI